MTTVAAGSTIGVLGSGQLGRMFAIAARRMGYRVHVFSADADTPAGQVADRETRASYDDADAVADFARGVDVATFEFENIPTSTIEIVQRFVPVRPGAHVLNVTQNRVCERAFLSEAGLPIPGCRPIRMEADMDALPRFPAVLKTATCGYDGKGQARVESAADVRRVWEAWGCVACILEEFVDFECELSVVGARCGWRVRLLRPDSQPSPQSHPGLVDVSCRFASANKRRSDRNCPRSPHAVGRDWRSVRGILYARRTTPDQRVGPAPTIPAT